MDQCTSGLILRTVPLTESSLIVHWLTEDFGRIATVAKGARRPKSPFLGKLDLFYLAELSFQPSRRSELHALREVSVRDFHNALRLELGYLQQASYFAQLLELTTETGTPLPGLLELLLDALAALPQAPPQALTLFAFELKLLVELGLAPDLAGSNLSPGAREIVQRLATLDWPVLLRFKLSPAQVDEVEHFLAAFLIEHFGRTPKARLGALRRAAVFPL